MAVGIPNAIGHAQCHGILPISLIAKIPPATCMYNKDPWAFIESLALGKFKNYGRLMLCIRFVFSSILYVLIL